MQDVEVEGVGTFVVPADWDQPKVQTYLKAYKQKHPDIFAPKGKAGGLEPLPEKPKEEERVGWFQRPKRKPYGTPTGLPKGILPQRSSSTIPPAVQRKIQKATRWANQPLLPEGSVPTLIGTLAAGGGPGSAATGQSFALAVKLHELGAERQRPAEQWIRNGVLNSVLDLGEVGDDLARGLSTPANVALLASMAVLPEEGAGALIARLTAAGFSATQAKAAADGLVRSYEKYQQGDYVGAGKELANTTVDAAFAILSGLGVRSKGGVKGRLREEWQNHFKRQGLTEEQARRAAEVQTMKSDEPPPAPVDVKKVHGQAEQEMAERQRGVTPQRTREAARVPPVAMEPLPKKPEENERVRKITGDKPIDPRAQVDSINAETEDLRKRLRENPNAPEAERRAAERRIAENRQIVQELGERRQGQRREGTSEPQAALPPRPATTPLPIEDELAMRAPESEQPGPELTQALGHPVAKSFSGRVRQAWKGIEGIVSPQGVTPTQGAKLRLRKALAQIAAEDEYAAHTLNQYRRMFDQAKLPMQATLEFIDRYEGGGSGMTDPRQVALAENWRRLQEDTWRKIRGREGMQSWIDDYFPHLFKDEKAARQIFSRRPLEGPRSWRYKRKFPTLKDALDFARENGVDLQPAYDNPVDYMTAKLHEMNKFIAMYDFVEEMKGAGVFRFKYGPPSRVEGMEMINDPIGRVGAPSRIGQTLREGYDEILFNSLNEFARSLGIDHVRKVKLRGGPSVWGYTIKGEERVWTKFAGPETVLTHELGHRLHFRYPELDALIKDKASVEELRKLADLRYEGRSEEDISEYYKRYVRRGMEKIANLIHAYVHMRERAKHVAPNTITRLEEILDKHDELRPLREIHPSLVLGTAELNQVTNLPGYRTLGHYYAPEPAARIINNYLSPSLEQRLSKFARSTEGLTHVAAAGIEKGYRGARYMANLLNQIQLGTISMFHFTFTSMDVAVSRFALGLQQVARGELKQGLKSFATGNIVTAPIEAFIRGNRTLETFYGTDRGQFYRDTVNRLIEAGGRVKMDSVYQNSSMANFLKAWDQRRYAGVALQSLPASVEALSYPVMQYWVPRMKLGVFSLLAEEELAKLPPDASLWDHRAALGRAWDSTDNRLGQLVYDNLFWARTARDLGHIMVRSLGWNLGTFREIGGGYLDLGKLVASRGQTGLTPKGAYTLALPIVLAMHGAILTYLMTGKGPQELLDYFYPPTGKIKADGSPERIAIPSYAKDELSYGLPFYQLGPERGMRHAFQTFSHKANPELAMVLEMARNRDFYGTKIRNEDDPFVKQAKTTGIYIAEQFEPFWIRNVQQRRVQAGEMDAKTFVESLFGIMPAPRVATRSGAEALASEYLAEKMGDQARSKEQAERAHTRGELIRQFRDKEPLAGKNLAKALAERKITPADRSLILRATRMTPLEMMVEHLGLEQALNVYERGTEKEKQSLKRVLRGKLHLLKSVPDEKRKELMKRIGKIFAKVPETELEPLPERP